MSGPRWVGVRVVALAGVLATSAVGCPCTDSMINESPWLRWQLFARYGADRVCQEMTKRGALIQASVPVPGFSNATGRFYPQTCQSQINDAERTLTLWMTGNGFAWTPATQKMSFECTVSVKYKPDFHKSGDSLWVWFDVAEPPPVPQFRIVHVEQAATNVALRLYGVEYFANALASSFVSGELAKGFTVIQEESSQDFSFGRLPAGQRPVHPFDVSGSERFTLLNESMELHGYQQDFLGPFEVDSKNRALFLRMQVTGSPVDVFVVSRDVGYAWRTQYQSTSPPPPPPTGAPIVQQLQVVPGTPFSAWVPVQKGLYYIVVDNSASAGALRPFAKLPTPFDPAIGLSSQLDYLVQVGERP